MLLIHHSNCVAVSPFKIKYLRNSILKTKSNILFTYAYIIVLSDLLQHFINKKIINTWIPFIFKYVRSEESPWFIIHILLFFEISLFCKLVLFSLLLFPSFKGMLFLRKRPIYIHGIPNDMVQINYLCPYLILHGFQFAIFGI